MSSFSRIDEKRLDFLNNRASNLSADEASELSVLEIKYNLFIEAGLSTLAVGLPRDERSALVPSVRRDKRWIVLFALHVTLLCFTILRFASSNRGNDKEQLLWGFVCTLAAVCSWFSRLQGPSSGGGVISNAELLLWSMIAAVSLWLIRVAGTMYARRDTIPKGSESFGELVVVSLQVSILLTAGNIIYSFKNRWSPC